MPQIFLQLLILAKVWNTWNINHEDSISTGGQSNEDFCGNQFLFAVSLGISIFQVGITLQDLMERDVPYGVFPQIISDEMRGRNLFRSILLQVLTFFYYSLNILMRLFSWVPFAIIFGFLYGFAGIFVMCFISRSILVAIILARSHNGRPCSTDGLKNFTIMKIMHKHKMKRENEVDLDFNRNENSAEYIESDDDDEEDEDEEQEKEEEQEEGDSIESEEEEEKGKGKKKTELEEESEEVSEEDEESEEESEEDENEPEELQQIKKFLATKNTSINYFHINALIAETIPWVLLSIFVDLPLSMKWLRLHNIDSLANNNVQIKTNNKINSMKYRFSRYFFIATNIISTIENMIMFVIVIWATRMVNEDGKCEFGKCVDCYNVEYFAKKERVQNLRSINKTCSAGKHFNTTECKVAGHQALPKALFEYYNKKYVHEQIILFYVLFSCLKFIASFVFYIVVWYAYGYMNKKKMSRNSTAMLRAQLVGRKHSNSLGGTFRERSTNLVTNRERDIV